MMYWMYHEHSLNQTIAQYHANYKLFTGIIGVIQFWNTLQLGLFLARAFLVELLLGFELHPALYGLNNSTFHHLKRIRTVNSYIHKQQIHTNILMQQCHDRSLWRVMNA